MKRLLCFIALTILCIFGCSRPVSAHVLQSDGPIGAVMHIEPDDDPSVNHPQALLFYFKDTTNRFSLAKCTCGLQIKASNKTMATFDLKATGDKVSQNPYTFTQGGTYEIVVTGQPKPADAFQPFKLTYIVNVQGGRASTKQIATSLAAGLLLLQALILVWVYWRVQRKST